MRTALFATILALIAPTVLAKPPKPLMTHRAKLDAKTRGAFLVVHPTRYVQVRCDTERGERPDVTDKALVCALVDLEEAAIQEVRFSTHSLHQALGPDLIAGPTWQNKVGHQFSTFGVRLAAYDPDAGTAGLLVRNSHSDHQARTWAQRIYYVAWDLKADEMLWHHRVDDFAGQDADLYGHFVHDAGPDSRGKAHYFWIAHMVPTPNDRGRQAVRVSLIKLDLVTRKAAWTHSFTTPDSNNPNIHSRLRCTPSPDRKLWIFTEYSEQGDGIFDPPPALTVLAAEGGEHYRMPVPPTPYGVAVSQDNNWLVIGSNQRGELHRYDLDKRKRTLKRKVLKRIHQLVLSADGKRIYVLANAQAVPVLRFPTLEPAGRIPAQRALKGEKYIAPERGAISHDRRFMVMPTTTDDHGFAERSGVHVVELR